MVANTINKPAPNTHIEYGYSCIYNVSPRKRVKPAADPKAGHGLGSTK
jgi:hypothetical protein